MSLEVTVLYDSDCPYAEQLRQNLREALAAVGLPQEWTELDRLAEGTPEHLRGFGSPTLLVGGKDVTGAEPGGGSCCRLYQGADGQLLTAPPTEVIVEALRKHMGGKGDGGGRSSVWLSLAAVPGSAGGVLAALVCPACLTVFAGLLAPLGLGFVVHWRYLSVVVIGLLGVTLFPLARRARAGRGWGPLGLALVGSAVILVSRFVWFFPPTTYLGVALLIGASVWNVWAGGAAGKRRLWNVAGKPGRSRWRRREKEV